MKIIQEFKEFAVKGNAFDLAVGVVIGAAFGKIVSSIVSDIMLPSIGIIIGGINFTGLKIVLKEVVVDTAGKISNEAVVLTYGNFIQTCFDFLIIAFSIFLVIKAINSFKRREEHKPVIIPEPTPEERLLAEIRDLLKSK